MSPPSVLLVDDNNNNRNGGGSSSSVVETEVEESRRRILALENEIARLRAENEALKKEKQAKEGGRVASSPDDDDDKTNNSKKAATTASSSATSKNTTAITCTVHHHYNHYQSLLSSDQIERYSRQLILQDGFGFGGVSGQQKLLSSKVLVVGAGGIGSTVLFYLASSGIGHITILDFDIVEKSNLHRQVIHTEERVGRNKAISACETLRQLNPTIDCRPFPIMLTHDNALDIINDHDCIVDASDNPLTRYLINDACVLANKPLISGSAIGTEGQLSVYNYGEDGPCYRCLYPKPGITAGSKSCSDNGVLGPVPGLIGVLQALETLKVLTNTGNTMKDRLLMYDSLQCSFLTIKKPKKQPNCPVCSSSSSSRDDENNEEDARTIIRSMKDSYNDLQSARGPNSCDAYIPSPLEDRYQISCQDYNNNYYNNYSTHQNYQQSSSSQHVLLDVRVKEQFDLCSLKNSINIPLDQLHDSMDQIAIVTNGWTKPLFTVCRRGVFSVEATKILNEYIILLSNKNNNNKSTTADDDNNNNKDSTAASTPAAVVENKNATTTTVVKNIRGGLEAWRKQVDETFPKY